MTLKSLERPYICAFPYNKDFCSGDISEKEYCHVDNGDFKPTEITIEDIEKVMREK